MQKTAYEMLISDWMSDVCSSDLVEDAQHRVVTALVAMIEPDQFAALAREGLAEDMVGRWLDAQRILARLQILPLILAGELALARYHFEAQADRVVDQRDRDLAAGIGDHFVMPKLFVEIHLRLGQGGVAGALPPRTRERRGGEE